MRKNLIILATALLSVMACSPKTDDYLDFLYSSMPLPDSLVHPREYWVENIDKTLEVRKRMGWNIPEREFRHFVLPVRVNNEDLDDFRTIYADTLCRRVEGMSLAEAAIEINHWCHEQATYRPSDARTLGPVATIRSGFGRCGEESVLAVAALRAAGIPARQVYTPRWAHTDDNHAWVEVWVDGNWHFMGACEPEPVLDLAWFNAPVSRAMLLHTKAFGNYEGPEDVIDRTSAYTEINVIRSYIPARRNTVTVLDAEGRPVEGAEVEFKIYNYAEFYTVARYLTDSNGQAGLDTGLGDIVVWAAKDGKFGLGKLSGETGEVVLDHAFGESFAMDLDIEPPAENPLPDLSTAAQKEINAARLAEEDKIRESHPHPKAEDPGIFLSNKDLIDVTPEVIADALSDASDRDRYVISPRIEREQLLPYRQEIRASGLPELLHSPAEAALWVKENIKIDDVRNPQGLRIPPVAVWRARIADRKSRDIFFVALCRSLGWAARINEVTASVQYMEDGRWIDADFDSGQHEETEKGTLVLRYDASGKAVKLPHYYTHFTLSRISGGRAQLCEYDETDVLKGSYVLDSGYYMLTSGTRMADGSVKAHVEFFNVEADGYAVKDLVLREDSAKTQVIGSMDAEQLFLPDGADRETSILSATGRGYFLLCVTGKGDEPSIHARRQLEAAAGAINEWGRTVVILGEERPSGIVNAIFGSDTDGKVAAMLRKGTDSGSKRLPVVALCDSFGRIVYYSEGYNTSLGEQVSATISRIRE